MLPDTTQYHHKELSPLQSGCTTDVWVGNSSIEDVVCSLSCVNVSIVYMTQFTVNGHCVGSSNN